MTLSFHSPRLLAWLVLLTFTLPLLGMSRRPPVEDTLEPEAVEERKSLYFYLDRLRDKDFVRRGTDGSVWYTAAEELGLIGPAAIPALIAKLDTGNDFERSQALYALKLAAQHEDVMVVTGGEQPDLSAGALPPVDRHPALVRAWKEWFARHGARFKDATPAPSE